MPETKKLNVYYAEWCPHCRRALAYLKEHDIPFTGHDMDSVTEAEEKLVTDANGGDDWVVPTLECCGKWIPGKPFSEASFTADLRALGVIK